MIDFQKLYADLEDVLAGAQMSWRDLAKLIGCSSSTFSRVNAGGGVSADLFMELAAWLEQPPTKYWTSSRAENV